MKGRRMCLALLRSAELQSAVSRIFNPQPTAGSRAGSETDAGSTSSRREGTAWRAEPQPNTPSPPCNGGEGRGEEVASHSCVVGRGSRELHTPNNPQSWVHAIFRN